MCGIIGYLGSGKIKEILLRGLALLEYRGYDSAGVAIRNNSVIERYRSVGNISELSKLMTNVVINNSSLNLGIGHTRWATHGIPSEANAHPHSAGPVYLVHNGIVENYRELAQQLRKDGYDLQPTSQTDTEILAHWLNFHLSNSKNSLTENLTCALNSVRGTFGLALIHANYPEQIIAVRRGSPIVIGKSNNEFVIASDPTVLAGKFTSIYYLEDNEMAICSVPVMQIINLKYPHEKICRDPVHLNLECQALQKDGYDHFLLKEIMQQPESVRNILLGRINSKIKIGGLTSVNLNWVQNILILGCGSAYYAGLLGKYLLESLIQLPIQVEMASEYCYRNPHLSSNTLGIIVSQSGETADTLACLNLLKQNNIFTFGLVNVVGSTIARSVNCGLYLRAGPEISVASTKAFTNQVLGLILTGLYYHQKYHDHDLTQELSSLSELPDLMGQVLILAESIELLAEQIKDLDNAMYLGRDTLYPIALEGALKMKEVAYVHAEGFSASEMKHGPIALIDDSYFVIFLLGAGELYEKSYTNLQQVLSRGASVIVITDTDYDLTQTIRIPSSSRLIQPLLFNLVLQLLAYYVAKARGCSIDQPRHLAKSVTVE